MRIHVHGEPLRPWWQIALLFVPCCLYVICQPARAYCDWMDRKF